MAVDRLIGVDFGTSTSVIRVKRYENRKPIGEKLETKEVIFGGNGAMVPTLVMRKDGDDSVCYFGYEAQQRKKNFSNFHSFKMDLESSDPEKRALARSLTEDFYSYLSKQYKSQSDGGHLGGYDEKESTIISYPVKWQEETKSFMLETARKAGFPNVTGMDEAQAAIQAVIVMSTTYLQKHGLLQKDVATNILLIDMGAGTTDLVLARYLPGDDPKMDVLNTWPKSGDVQFGGREVDGLLQTYFQKLLCDEDAQTVEKIFRRVGIDKFKSWKEETVSPALHKKDSVNDFAALDERMEDEEIDLEYCLDRAAFENCLSDYLKQFPELINGCLQNAGMSGSDVDLVIVTGGHSQWYFVNEMLSGKLPQFGNLDLPKIRENPARIIPISRPQETVALGLAYSGIHIEISGGKSTESRTSDGGAKIPDSTPAAQEETVFTMKIEQIFPVSGGTAVGGTVSSGKIKTGDTVSVYNQAGEILEGRVKSIATPGTGVSFKNGIIAVKDEFAVLCLEGIKQEDLSEDMILFKGTNDQRHILQAELTKILEKRKQSVSEQLSSDDSLDVFSMKIDPGQVYAAEQGTVVYGVIEEGRVVQGDRVYICGRAGGQSLSDSVKRIEYECAFVPTAQKGDRVGLLLPFLKKYEVTMGTYLSSQDDTSKREQDAGFVARLVKRFFAEYPHVELQKFSDINHAAIATQRARLCVPPNEPILVAADSALFFSGTVGTIITPNGIYIREDFMQPDYISWSEFVEGKLTCNNVSRIYLQNPTTGINRAVGYFLGKFNVTEAMKCYKALQEQLRLKWRNRTG